MDSLFERCSPARDRIARQDRAKGQLWQRRLVTDTPAALTESRTLGTAADVLFTFSFETYHDARYRGMMRPPDRLLQTLQYGEDMNRLFSAAQAQ